MRFADVLQFALSALWQQKVRTALTALGVIIGSFVLVASISIGQGFHAAVVREFRKQGELRKIGVWPRYESKESDIPADKLQVKGTMSDAKRERIRRALVRHWSGRYRAVSASTLLTPERLVELAAIDHVRLVSPSIRFYDTTVSWNGQAESTRAEALPEDMDLDDRLIAGELFPRADDRSALVSEFLLYQWGVAEDEKAAAVVGQKIRLEFRTGSRGRYLLPFLNANIFDVRPADEKLLEKVVSQLPALLAKLDMSSAEKEQLNQLIHSHRRPAAEPAAWEEEFTVVGIIRDSPPEENQAWWFDRGGVGSYVDVLLPMRTAERLFARLPHFRAIGYDHATVAVDDEAYVRAVVRQIKSMGFNHHSLAEFVDQVRFNVLLISFTTTFIAGIALLVAAVGITNTMLMSVLERTHEIGVMKAVGARNRHIQGIFLVEGAMLGLSGGAVGLFLAWLAAFPADAVARSLVQEQTQLKLEESLFVFPFWLTAGVPLFAMVITTLAAYYPARRAARVNPVESLRHE